MASSISSAATGIICTVPWCKYVGTDKCHAGATDEGVPVFDHTGVHRSFDFHDADGERVLSGWVDVAANDRQGQHVGVALNAEATRHGYIITPAEARQVAAALLNAADKVDEINAMEATR